MKILTKLYAIACDEESCDSFIENIDEGFEKALQTALAAGWVEIRKSRNVVMHFCPTHKETHITSFNQGTPLPDPRTLAAAPLTAIKNSSSQVDGFHRCPTCNQTFIHGGTCSKCKTRLKPLNEVKNA
jgi:hypothetical protein